METSGSISGTVTDTDGESLPGVVVSATGEWGPRDTVTNAEGRYRLRQLQPGSYTLKAELEGFDTVVIPDVIVRVEQDTVCNMKMKISTIEEGGA